MAEIAVMLPSGGPSFPTWRVFVADPELPVRIDVIKWSREWWVETYDQYTGMLIHKRIVPCYPGVSVFRLACLALREVQRVR